MGSGTLTDAGPANAGPLKMIIPNATASVVKMFFICSPNRNPHSHLLVRT